MTNKQKNKKIRVAHLIGSTGLYGAERWVLALMRALDRDRIDATLINLVDEQGVNSEVVAAAHQRDLAAFDFFTEGKFNPFSVARLAKWVRRERVDIIHGHGFKSDAVGFLTARLAGCKIITTPHGWSLENNTRLKIYEKLDRSLFRYMDMICPLSPDLVDGITKCADGKKIRYILNGVDIDEVKSAIPADKNHSGCYLIGYIGQLIDRKDLNTLISSIKILCDANENIRCIVIGDGSRQNDLRDEAQRLGISSNIEFMGFRSDASAYLKILDLFVLPSRMEGIPRCIMEAMAAGIPVIVSDIPGNRDLVIHGETGLLFTPGDSRDLAKKIVAMMKQPEVAQAMAFRGRGKIEAEFSSRKMAYEYTNLYFDLVGTNINTHSEYLTLRRGVA